MTILHFGKILGMPSSTINRNSSSGSSNKPMSSKNSLNFNVGDKVQVVQDIQTLKDLQENHGGYNPRMAEVNIFDTIY